MPVAAVSPVPDNRLMPERTPHADNNYHHRGNGALFAVPLVATGFFIGKWLR
jgi:hypothetical protein